MIRHIIISVVLVTSCLVNIAHAEQDWLYSVRPGDNLWNLCIKYTTRADCWLKLGDYNNVEYPRQLPPGLIIRFPISWLKEIPTPVTLRYFSGEVTYKKSAESEVTPVVMGLKLPIGAMIQTGTDGIAGLEFGDGTQMQVEPNSVLLLDALSVPGEGSIVDSRIRLQSGAVKSRVPERQPKSRFRISTPAAIAAVRGTEFRVSSYTDDTGVPLMSGEVFEGIVAVAAPSVRANNDQTRDETAKEVRKGYGIFAELGKTLSEPEPLAPAPEWKQALASQLPPISLSWQSLEAIKLYRIEVSALAEDSLSAEQTLLAVHDTELTSFQDVNNELTQGCYLFAVRGLADSGLLGLAAKQKVCIRDQLSVPVLDHRKLTLDSEAQSVSLSWSAVASATGYQVQVSLDKNFDEIASTIEVDTHQFDLPITQDLTNGFYYRVKANALERVESDYSEASRVKAEEKEPLLALSIWAVFWVLVVAL